MKLFEGLKSIKFTQRHVPWLLLGISLIAYGIMIRGLGFYWDDWEILYLSEAAQTPSDVFLFPFRPVHVWLDIATVKLLGFHPLSWHLLTLVIRYLGGLVFWLFLKEMWPRQTSRNAWAAALFLVYPSFLHQSISVVYRQHFTTALLYLLSMWLMVRAFRLWQAGDRGRFWFVLGLSLLTGAGHLFLMEYFAALELLRPLVMLFLVLRDKTGWKVWMRRLALFWLPYLAYVAGYAVWRLMFVQSSIDDPNKTVLLDRFRALPLNTLRVLVQDAVLDFGHLLLGSWQDTLSPELVDFSSLASIGILILTVVCGIMLYWLLGLRFQLGDGEGDAPCHLEVMLVSLAGVILGLMPAWLLGRNIYEGHYDTRFSIPALAGISLLLVGMVFYLISDRKKIALLMAVLVAIGISRQLHMTVLFREDWQRQTSAYWQIHWRAPELEPNTAILVNRSVTSYATTYPVAYAANLLYAPEKISLTPDYWWLEIYERNLYGRVDELLGGGKLGQRFHYVAFEATGDQVVVFNLPTYNERRRCVWLLSPSDVVAENISPEMRQMARLSDLGRITSRDGAPPPEATFGMEPDLGWCMYYQQASLAVQFEDWEAAAGYFDRVQDAGLVSQFGYEYMPFITGLAGTGEWQAALDLTTDTIELDHPGQPSLCTLWRELSALPGGAQPADEAIRVLDCE